LTRRRVWRVIRIVFSLAAVAIAVVIIAGKTNEIEGATTALDDLQPVWLVGAVVAEAFAIVSFAAMQRVLLAAGGSPIGLGPLTAITLGGNALQNSLPGGAAVATVFAFRQFRARGADDVLAGWMLVAVSLLSAVSIAVIAAVGVAVSAGQANASNLVGAVLVTVLAAFAAAFAVKRGAIGVVVRWAIGLSQRVIGRPQGDGRAIIERTIERLRTVSPTWPDWGVAGAMALGNWLWDCGALALAFLAIDVAVPWRGLLLAYGAGQLAANLPITPGGLGVVEGSLTVALVAYGGAETSTVAAVLLYRLISFWALLPLGWASIGGLAWRNRRAALEVGA
jgi:uncharacterized protein (TIRG00374 family)